MRKLLVPEVIADFLREICAFGFGRKKILIEFWRDLKIAVSFTTVKLEVEQAFGRKIRHRIESARIQGQPVHRLS